MPKFLFLALLLLFPLSLFGQNPGFVAGFVDSRQALMMHPLFRQFDPGTRRFLETSSAFVTDPEAARKEYVAKSQAIEKQLQDLDRRLQTVAKESNVQVRKQAMEQIFSTKAELKLRLSELKKASEATTVYGNYFHGTMTGNESLIPILKQILGDIYTAFRQVSLNHQGIPVFDLAAFGCVSDKQICDRAILFSNYHFALYGQNANPVVLRNWLHHFRLYLRDRDPARYGHPFVSGIKDLRNESVKLLSFGTR